jgi:hypothetical protein
VSSPPEVDAVFDGECSGEERYRACRTDRLPDLLGVDLRDRAIPQQES